MLIVIHLCSLLKMCVHCYTFMFTVINLVHSYTLMFVVINLCSLSYIYVHCYAFMFIACYVHCYTYMFIVINLCSLLSNYVRIRELTKNSEPSCKEAQSKRADAPGHIEQFYYLHEQHSHRLESSHHEERLHTGTWKYYHIHVIHGHW